MYRSQSIQVGAILLVNRSQSIQVGAIWDVDRSQSNEVGAILVANRSQSIQVGAVRGSQAIWSYFPFFFHSKDSLVPPYSFSMKTKIFILWWNQACWFCLGAGQISMKLPMLWHVVITRPDRGSSKILRIGSFLLIFTSFFNKNELKSSDKIESDLGILILSLWQCAKNAKAHAMKNTLDKLCSVQAFF